MECTYYEHPQGILHEKELKAELVNHHGEGAVFLIRLAIEKGTYIPQDSELCNDKLCQESHQNPIDEEECYKLLCNGFLSVQIFTLLKYIKNCYNRLYADYSA